MRIPEEAIPAAAFVFEAGSGRVLSDWESSEIGRHGFNGIDANLLSRELIHLIEAEHKSDSRDRQQAYWALGKKHDLALLAFFRKQLELELRRDMYAAYQIMIALDNLDEPVFAADRSGYSSNEYELNRSDAERYLASVTPGAAG